MTMFNGTTANGVPFVARSASDPAAPVIAVWHLMDPPNTPAAMAAALPLSGLDAHTVYFGLPLTGTRAEHTSFEVFLASGVDMVTEFFGPMHEQALAEFPEAMADVRSRLGASDVSTLCVLGGSAGASVAAGVAVAQGAVAAVLMNPMLQLRPMIDAMADSMPPPYVWTPASDAVAARLDFVARARDFGETHVLVIEGAEDETAFLNSVREFESLGVGEVRYVEGVEHPLADWPGSEPAPQIEAAKAYDALAVDFLRRVIS